MRTAFHPFLPNGPFGDPVLWVDLPDEGHSVLIDLGELHAVPARKLLRVGRVVVSHTHMDHFIGFDHLLRLLLGRESELVVTGPAGFLDHVAGKLAGYAWNLIESYPVCLVAEEIDGDVVRSATYRGATRLRRTDTTTRPFTGKLHDHRAYTIEARVFDHGIPVLGVVLRETERLSVDKDRLTRRGLTAGPWLRTLKHAVRRREPRGTEIEIPQPGGGVLHRPIGELADEILFRAEGQALGYLTDLRFTPPNVERAVELFAGVDLLVCEAVFLHADEELARSRGHLTARQAGELARGVGARRLAPFHFSPRYAEREQDLCDEAAEAFGGPLVRLSPLGDSNLMVPGPSGLGDV